ncbi:ribonuclease HII [Candidatus Poribacteria bacterium]|nr:ribonuclease HII [Candidatus Poribacteria bacterium]
MDSFERACSEKGYTRIAGIDEAGRGALAGPVVAAAVILPYGCQIDNLKDSKQLTPRQRSSLFDEIYNLAVSVSIGSADNNLIDHINILQATLHAMKVAVKQLTPKPDFLLVDGNKLPDIDIPAEAIPKGDNLSISIAAASVIAKTTRDRLMIEFHQEYPNYGFQQHKGYPTVQHRQAIAQFGVSPIHRKTFKLLAD